MSVHEHFLNLLQWLRLERDEDLRQYKQLVREQPLTQRVELGYSWYPLKLVATGFTFGEKVFVTVERTTYLDQPHQLRAGQSVSVFSNRPHLEKADCQGIIHYIDRNKMKIILNGRDVPEWLAMGQIGIDMLFDDRSYLEMERALNAVMHARRDRLAELRDIFLGIKEPHFHEIANKCNLPELNESQNRALDLILSARDVAIVHGPPGTGKTTTLVAAIQLLSQREKTVLVTAPSNTAADLLTERLAAAGVNVVRVGNLSRIDESIVQHTLDFLLSRHPDHKHIKKVKLKAAELRRQANRYFKNYGRTEREEKQHLRMQSRELELWANELEQHLLDQILDEAQVVVTTLVGAAHPVLEKLKFRTCVMDEAAQALEPAAWIPITKSSKVIFAGDPLQLPPTVKNLEAARAGLSATLMEKWMERHPQAVQLLQVQYRMHRKIMGFSNSYFYGNSIQAHESVAEHRLVGVQNQEHMLTFFDPIIFVDTAGCGFEEKIQYALHKNNMLYYSRYNPDEALLLREQLLRFIRLFPADALPDLAIISPYREQVNYIESMILEDENLAWLLAADVKKNQHKKLIINTIDGFQGQERDVVFISLVRANLNREIGFLQDYRRMNVALTRARKLLIVTGDSSTLGGNKFYDAFLSYCEREGKYQTAWEYMR